MLGLAAVATLLVSSGPASSMDLEATIDFGNSVVANGLTMVDANTATADLTQGDIIAISINADNLTADLVSAIFATLTWDGNLVAFLGGGFTGPILVGTCTGFICSPPSLSPGISAPQLKPLSPFNQGTGDTDWLQTYAHTNPTGTTGTGPDLVANLGFEVLAGGVGMTQIDFDVILEPNSDTVAGAMGGAFLGPVNLIGAAVNVPEPGALALGVASLLTVGAAASWRRRMGGLG
jgi:hypothetical protein